MRSTSPARSILVPLSLCSSLLLAQSDPPASPITDAHLAGLAWRSIGPSNMGGRITDIELAPGRPSTIYLATAGGGLWKSRNAGTTWEPLFQHQGASSIGDVAVAPSNADVVWVGTGEENARNSVSYGNGVYKSIDGGQTWRNTGLHDSFQIGHIAIHPGLADTVFVAALGTLWGPNSERGVFRTRDGGNTWSKVLFVDEWTGCIDVRLDPEQPEVVYAAMYERARDEFDSNDPAVRFGAKGGFFKSTDGGDTWKKLEQGLPTCRWGRSALCVSQKNPAIVYAMIETERTGWATGEQKDARARRTTGNAYMGVSGEDGDNGARLTVITSGGPAAESGLLAGDTIVQIQDAKIGSYNELLSYVRSNAAAGDKMKVTVVRDGARQELEVAFGARPGSEQPGGGGGGFGGNSGPFGGRLGGQQHNIQDEQGDLGFETGGVFRSDDRGETWKRVNSLTERPFYYSVLAVDPQSEDILYVCGVQFMTSNDGGKKFTDATRGAHVDFHAVVVDPTDQDHVLLGGDGGLNVSWDRCQTWETCKNLVIGQFYHVDVDNSVPYRVYGGLQDNGTWGGPSRTRNGAGITYDDWVQIYGGDGFTARIDPENPHIVYATSQNGNVGRVDMRTQSTPTIPRPRGASLQFNWDTPFFLSPHNPRVLYLAGNHAIRHHVGAFDQDQRGARAERSEALTEKPLGLTERGTATAMAESPLRPGLLYVGTDDGALWRTQDNGHTWEELHAKLTELPGPRYVSSIHPSRFRAERVYATFDGHRSNDFDTHVFVSDDAGDTWKSLEADLPNEPVHVCREDNRNEDLLFVGTEFGCYASLDRGEHWLSLGQGLPTVAVRDLVIQDRDAELVAATHGRGIWIVDIAPLRELTEQVAKSDVHLFQPRDAILWHMHTAQRFGNKVWYTPNPPNGATFYVTFAATPEKAPTLTVHDITGAQVASLTGKRTAGLQALHWPDSGRGGRGFGGRGRGGAGAVQPGSYSVRMQAGERELVQAFRLLPDPDPANRPAAASSSSPSATANRAPRKD